MRWLPFVAVLVGACTPRAVTPPSRTFVMSSPSAPAVGGTDVQLDAATIGQLWGPELAGGNARLRHTIEPGVSLEADGGVLHVTNDGQGGDRNAYTGRLGVLLHSQSRHLAFGAGLGGGTSATAGSWGSADVHAVVSGAHRYIRPMLGVGAGYSAPFGNKTFVVQWNDSTDGDSQRTLRLPRNLFAQLHLGVELGPPHAAFILGGSVLRFWLREDSVVDRGGDAPQLEDGYLAVGVGLRLAFR